MKFAVTGGIAAGKTLVADMLRDQGIVLLDADRLALDFISNSTEMRERITAEFGEDSFTPEGQLNRKLLASRVFTDSSTLIRYNAIYQSAWLEQLRYTIDAAAEQGTVGLDAALIGEWKIADWFEMIILVRASPEVRIARLQKTRGMSRKEAGDRIQTQMSDRDRQKIATEVIVNDSGVEELRRDVKRLARLIMGASTRI
jgi:dephospho-CoA kinase